MKENLAITYFSVSTLLVLRFLWLFRTRFEILIWFLSHSRNRKSTNFWQFFLKLIIYTNVYYQYWFPRYGAWRADWRILWIYICIYRMFHNRISIAQEQFRSSDRVEKLQKLRHFSLHQSVGSRTHSGFSVVRLTKTASESWTTSWLPHISVYLYWRDGGGGVGAFAEGF